MQTIPLFPLSVVLLPGGRLPLQIFERRYLDLVTRCLKQDDGFGVVWLRHGAEVDDGEPAGTQRLAPLGCFASIVDCHQLDNGLLGIVVEGQRKFRLLSSERRPDRLQMAEVEWLPAEPDIPMPTGSGELRQLLRTLLEHPDVAQLGIDPEVEDAGKLSNILGQLLPVEEATKFQLLAEAQPLQRLDFLMQLLEQLNQ